MAFQNYRRKITDNLEIIVRQRMDSESARLHALIVRALSEPDPEASVLQLWQRRGFRIRKGWVDGIWRHLWQGWVERAQGNKEWLAQAIMLHWGELSKAA
jgi:hypothetical protein